jgi:DNA repair protein RadA/Sms
MGRCPECGEWGTFVEEPPEASGLSRGGTPMGPPQSINGISLFSQMRWKSTLSEFDRTLGGGVVPGSLVLIGGDPGIGKSTLVLQVLGKLSERGYRTLYLSGEESPQQIKLRAERLSIRSEELYILAGTCVEELLEALHSLKPHLLVVDSIQTVYSEKVNSPPGSVGQVRSVTSKLLTTAKESGISVFLVGHVTKEGTIAGPKVLEHLVDTVLYFEGDGGHAYRILRAVKNRYGSTNEIGVFEMKDTGLAEVGNPSQIFLEERPRGVSGSVVIPCLEGTRPVLVEIQALVGASTLGVPRRTAIGVDHHRISLLVAVLGKRMGMEMGGQDIFVNVAGGLTVQEPAADLGIVSAMMSSFLNRPVDRNVVVFGEVGLAGEVRGVSRPDLRIQEAGKLGFSSCLIPKRNLEGCGSPEGVTLVGVESIQEVYDILFG